MKRSGFVPLEVLVFSDVLKRRSAVDQELQKIVSLSRFLFRFPALNSFLSLGHVACDTSVRDHQWLYKNYKCGSIRGWIKASYREIR
jgi:hypothetical protein